MGEGKIVVRPSRWTRVSLGIGCAMYLAVALFSVVVMIIFARASNPAGDAVTAVIVFGGLALVSGWAFVLYLRAWLTVWEAGKQNLTSRGWVKKRTVRWDEIVRYRVRRSGTGLTYVFYDAAGRRRAAVDFWWLDRAGRPLLELMQRKLREVLPGGNHDRPETWAFLLSRGMLRPSPLADLPARIRWLRQRARRQLWLMLGMAAIMAASLGFVGLVERVVARFEREAKPSRGVVTSVVQRGARRYVLTYRFTTREARSYSGEADITKTESRRYHVGDPIRVRYVTRGGTTSLPVGRSLRGACSEFYAVPFLGLIIPVQVLVWQWFARRRTLRALREMEGASALA